VTNIFDLTGRTAVVTGGGTHIGRSIAMALARFGARVHITGRRADMCEEAAAAIQRQQLHCTAHACDASDETAMERLCAEVAAETGRLDILIANAAGRGGRALAPTIGREQWDETFRLTVTTAAVSAQAAVRHMDPQVGGRIIFVGSIHGFLGADPRMYGRGYSRSGSDYHAAKGAIVNLTRSLACELGPVGVNVNCVSPGQIPPGSTDDTTTERFRLSTPLGICGVPSDLDGVVVLLSSAASRFITGQNIVVDGGWSAW